MTSRANARLGLTAANAYQKANRAFVEWSEDPTPAKRAVAERKQALYMRHRAAVIAAEWVSPVAVAVEQLTSLSLDPQLPCWARRRLYLVACVLNQVSVGAR